MDDSVFDPGGLTDLPGDYNYSPDFSDSFDPSSDPMSYINSGALGDLFGGGGGLFGGAGAGNGIPALAAGLPLLGLGLGLTGLASGGQQSATAIPRMNPFASQALGQAGSAAASMLPAQLGLFNQGAGLLSQLGAGQMPAAFQNLTQQAFQPYIGSIDQQAIEAARNRGFAGGADLLTHGGPASQLAGPALANLPGLEAQFQTNNILRMISALTGQGTQGVQNLQSVASGYPSGQRTQQQPSLLQQISQMGPVLQGFGQAGAAFQPNPLQTLWANYGLT